MKNKKITCNPIFVMTMIYVILGWVFFPLYSVIYSKQDAATASIGFIALSFFFIAAGNYRKNVETVMEDGKVVEFEFQFHENRPETKNIFTDWQTMTFRERFLNIITIILGLVLAYLAYRTYKTACYDAFPSSTELPRFWITLCLFVLTTLVPAILGLIYVSTNSRARKILTFHDQKQTRSPHLKIIRS